MSSYLETLSLLLRRLVLGQKILRAEYYLKLIRCASYNAEKR